MKYAQLGAAMIAVQFMVSLDQSVLSVGGVRVATEFGDPLLQVWIAVSYLSAVIIMTPVIGALADGRDLVPLFHRAIAVFAAGSIACSLADGIVELTAARVLQGLGAGALLALPQVALTRVPDMRIRERLQSSFLIVFVVASISGPAIGGAIAGTHIAGIGGWRWIFAANVPLCLLSVIMLARTDLPATTTARSAPVDRVSWLMLGIGVVCTTVGLNGIGRFSIAAVAGLLLVAACAGVAFGARARKGRSVLPTISSPAKRHRAHLGFAATFIAGAVMFGTTWLLPSFLQGHLHHSAVEAGQWMLLVATGTVACALLVNRLAYRSTRIVWLPQTSLLLLATGATVLSVGGPRSAVLVPVLLAIGVGLGGIVVPLMLLMQRTLGPEVAGAATTTTIFFRQFGGIFGVAALFGVAAVIGFTAALIAVAAIAITAAFMLQLIAEQPPKPLRTGGQLKEDDALRPTRTH
ncbi:MULTISPECIES: MFS transporter [Nocardia]|uniref:MFS transporter n=1 Tax=Nocardia TaxID=1817 RepID=UPI000BF2221F|nr:MULTISPECIES: MFS transporter [Nocardia]MBF6187038.1 MFS transporter [Nocardia farcinica]MBF6312685.1 MFS transporter [Nocardia farcinica]MBF6408460.1 MFS transporter [Nocardia farcinica]PEH78919.1 hypothetical protein CRM89_25530 [Nocardia sp. FDAARGOS_372]UEX23545.1 MFS transporter [Nocardia farcinica]